MAGAGVQIGVRVASKFLTDKFITTAIHKLSLEATLRKYGEYGVIALKAATPYDSGKTAESWDYEIQHRGSRSKIIWKNSNINKGVPIAVILQYGHGTGTGGYVQGVDYINPALKPVFQNLADEAWREVTSG